ncbi:DUF5988 family protein [Streptomyces sp. NPDC058653]|uniref:DUF5988 family protein n=1 Tax=Streptomyces sp. NPDC058653 TaxID=3346576 RepID=UPI003654C0BA
MVSEVDTDPKPTVVLVGGPPELGTLFQIPAGVLMDASRLVVKFYGQHQHFEPTGETHLIDGRLVPVFSFTYSTAIAE